MGKQMQILEALKKVHEDIFDDMDSETLGDKEDISSNPKDIEDVYFVDKKYSDAELKALKNYLMYDNGTFLKGKWEYTKTRREYFVNIPELKYTRFTMEVRYNYLNKDKSGRTNLTISLILFGNYNNNSWDITLTSSTIEDINNNSAKEMKVYNKISMILNRTFGIEKLLKRELGNP